MSQLVVRLGRELDATTEPGLRAELIARIAGYNARIGKFDEARQQLEVLRGEFNDGRSGRATIWIMLAEGLLHLFSDLSPHALERVAGAQALAIAMKYQPAIAYASAWKAHIEFERSEYDSMVKSLQLGLSTASPKDEDAITRISIILSSSFMVCGDRSTAQRWFTKGHESAVRNGDQASIEALLYNRTVHGLALIRTQLCLGEGLDIDIKLARREIESTKNLQLLTGSAALTNHTCLWGARLSVIEGRYESAAEELSSIKGSGPFSSYNFSDQMLNLEIAFCKAKAGDVDAALADYSKIDFGSMAKLDDDERLAVAWMRLKLGEMDDRFGTIVNLQDDLAKISSTVIESRVALRQKLASWNDCN